MTQESKESSTQPTWCPEKQIYIGGIVPENAEVKSLIEKSGGYLRLFGYGSLCWNPGTGALGEEGVIATTGKARGYKRCWSQKSTDHRGIPPFPGIVCTLLEDQEVSEIRKSVLGIDEEPTEPTMTEGVIYLIPPDLVDKCLEELDFREKGGYARDIIDVVEDDTGNAYQAVLYRGTPDNPAFWNRALLDLPLAAAIMSVSEGPSGKNDFYLNSLDEFLTGTHTKAGQNDDTTSLAIMTKAYQQTYLPFFLVGAGSNQHNQLLLDRQLNVAGLCGEDAHEMKEIIVTTFRESNGSLAKELYAGGGHSGLLTADGKLFLWGWNDSFQCGPGSKAVDTVSTQFPVVSSLDNIMAEKAALGFSHTLVVEKGSSKLYAFGNNERGQVDGYPSDPKSTPITPEFLKEDKVCAIAAGLFHSAVVNDKGEVITFGCGRFGQSLSSEENSGDVWIGRWKPSDGSKVIDVACGRRHTLLLDNKSRLWSFGENKYGQLGRNIEGKFDATPSLVENLEYSTELSIAQIDCGWSHNLITLKPSKGDITLYGWGRNDKGQLGIGKPESVRKPVPIFPGTNVVGAACGSEFIIALDKDGKVSGCGWNEHGNLATGDQNDSFDFTKASGAKIIGQGESRYTFAVGGAHFIATKVVQG